LGKTHSTPIVEAFKLVGKIRAPVKVFKTSDKRTRTKCQGVGLRTPKPPFRCGAGGAEEDVRCCEEGSKVPAGPMVRRGVGAESLGP